MYVAVHMIQLHYHKIITKSPWIIPLFSRNFRAEQIWVAMSISISFLSSSSWCCLMYLSSEPENRYQTILLIQCLQNSELYDSLSHTYYCRLVYDVIDYGHIRGHRSSAVKKIIIIKLIGNTSPAGFWKIGTAYFLGSNTLRPLQCIGPSRQCTEVSIMTRSRRFY